MIASTVARLIDSTVNSGGSRATARASRQFGSSRNLPDVDPTGVVADPNKVWRKPTHLRDQYAEHVGAPVEALPRSTRATGYSNRAYHACAVGLAGVCRGLRRRLSPMAIRAGDPEGRREFPQRAQETPAARTSEVLGRVFSRRTQETFAGMGTVYRVPVPVARQSIA